MNEAWTKKFYDAIAPLTWGFEEGDDGSLITLALDEATSLLEQLPRFIDVSASSLGGLLRAADLSEELDDLGPIDVLYEIGEQHNYGAGLTHAEARQAAEVAEEVCSLLEEVLSLVNPGEPQ